MLISKVPISDEELKQLYGKMAQKLDLVNLVPTSISFQGRPLDILHKRPMFSPMFRKNRSALRDVFICGRQIGKTVSISSSILMHCWWRNYFRMLYVCLLYTSDAADE